ncbi:MAG: hypothetical protein CME62_16960 [Halobacteriovoraceae bacterium]|nr:hypothetical protein [Halobacteriovoraceae bacterium]|tara:strand:- start:2818 stop:4962 length:2145 start_codon:yes stop_codon:yes gene_type:complete
MKKYWLGVILALSLSAFAQNSTQVLEALSDGQSSWSTQFRDNNGQSPTGSSGDVEFEKTTDAADSCSREDQNSVPYSFFASLLQRPMQISQDATAGTITLDGGMMISNCNNMLKYNFSRPQDGRPYLFQVEVRKPAGCNTEKCSYTVALANDPDNPQIRNEDVEMEFEPNYWGYVACLEAAGVVENGELNPNKIIPAPFNHQENGLVASEEVLFYSRGPEGTRQGAKYQSKSSMNNGTCGFYEQIVEGGFSYTSADDIRAANAQNLYERLCAQGDHNVIDQHLPELLEFRNLYEDLIEVRNVDLLNDVKELHELLKTNDYSDLDAEEFREIIEKYYDKIILPLKSKIANKYNQLRSTPRGEARDRLRAELNELTAKLMAYNKAPYLNAADYEKMKDFARKAPLEKQAWRDAALVLYTSNNTAFHYSRYNEEVRANNSDMRELSISAANALIRNFVADERDELADLGRLASNPDLSIAQEYARGAQTIKRSQQYNIQQHNKFVQEEQQHAYSHCMNPRKYWINRQKCMQEVQRNIMLSQHRTQQFNQGLDSTYATQIQQAQRWAQIEAARNGGQAPSLQMQQQSQSILGFQNQPYQMQQQQNQFAMNPGNYFGQGAMQGGGQSFSFQPQQMQFGGQQIPPGGVQGGFQGGAMGQWGFNRNPAGMPPQQQGYWGYQQTQMPQAMGYFQNSQYGAGSPMMGGPMGGQMIGGGTPFNF